MRYEDYLEKYQKALDYAIKIIEAYQVECNNIDEYLKDNNSNGFCKGSIFRESISDIKNILK